MVLSFSFPSVASAASRSTRRCFARGQLQTRQQRNCHQYANYLRDATPYNRTFNRITPSISIGNSVVEELVLTKKRHRFARFHSTKTTSSSSSLSSKSIMDDDSDSEDNSVDDIPTPQSSSLPQSSSDDEYFEVTKIITQTGEIETIQLLQTEIITQTTLSPRDLVSLRLASKKERREDWAGNTLMEQMRHPPTIMAKNDFILLSLGPLRAVAERNVVYVFDVHNEAARSFTKYLSLVYRRRSDRMEKIRSREMNENQRNAHIEEPTELVFLETVLADAVDSFTSRILIFEPIVNDLLQRISTQEEFSDTNLVHQMAPLMDQLKSFEIYVTQAYDCLMQLLNDDEAMLQLLLTEQEEARKANTLVDFERHQHVEHILGIYARRVSSIIQETKYLVGRIESKQDFIELELDLYRNRLIRMNIDLAILATATGVTTALTGTFGMNMINGLEDSPTAFAITSGVAAITALSIAYYFRRMVSGNVIQQRADHRIGEIQTMANALSDMTALDYTVKKMMRGEIMSKEEFKQKLITARQSKKCTDKEIDLLFNVLNTNKNDVLCKDDFLNERDKEGMK